jgi:hypothetical protein
MTIFRPAMFCGYRMFFIYCDEDIEFLFCRCQLLPIFFSAESHFFPRQFFH